MKILLSVKAFEKMQDYIMETLIDTGCICENRLEAVEYIDSLINIDTITDLQHNMLVETVINYSDELLDQSQKK